MCYKRRGYAPSYQIGEKVYLKAKNISLKSPKKFKPCYLGPFIILEKINEVAYKLKLPEELRIHNVNYTSLLKRSHPDNLEVTVFRGDSNYTEYEVNKIVNHKKMGRGYKCLINWKGWSCEEDTWEPEASLTENCNEILQEYKTFKNL